MKRHWWKRGLSVLLAAAMVLTAQPFADGNMVVYAAEQEELVSQEENADVVEESEVVLQETEALPESEGLGVSEMEKENDKDGQIDPAENKSIGQSEEETIEQPEEVSEVEESTDVPENVIAAGQDEVSAEEEISEISEMTEEEQQLEPMESIMDVLESGKESQEIALDTFTCVNPIYEGIIDSSDLNPISENSAVTLSDSDEYFTLEQAAEQVKKYMLARIESFQIKYQTTKEYSQELVTELFEQATVHTGVPTEGDYLAWQYGGYSAAPSYHMVENVYYYTITYTPTYYTTAAQEAKMDTAVDGLLKELNLGSATDYQKVRSIYDYICKHVTYDFDNLNDKEYKLKYTAYAALLDGTAVCQGYAVLFYRLALELGVDSRLIAGTGAGGAHGWNIVKLDGRYYNLDATWDAPRAADNVEYAYFLKCNANFGDHIRGDEYSNEEFVSAYPMGEIDYTPSSVDPSEDERNGLIYTQSLEYGEEGVIQGIFAEGESIWTPVGEDWQTYIGNTPMSVPGQKIDYELYSTCIALFYQEYNKEDDSYTYTLLHRSDIQIVGTGKPEVKDRDNYYLELSSQKPESYEISYTADNGTTYSLSAAACWPRAGFYRSDEKSEEAFLGDRVRYNDDYRTVYLILEPGDENSTVALNAESPFTIMGSDGETTVNGYLTWEKLSDTLYKVTIDEEREEEFCLIAHAEESHLEEGEVINDSFPYYFFFEKAPTSGMVFASDLKMDDEGNILGILPAERENEDFWYEKDNWIENISNINHNWTRDGVPSYDIPEVWLAPFLAEYQIESDMDDDSAYKYTVLSNVTVISADASVSVEWDGEYIHIRSEAGGTCTLGCTIDGKTYTQQITLGLPGIGFYKASTPSAESFLYQWNYEYNSGNRSFYLVYDEKRGEREAREPVWYVNGAGLPSWAEVKPVSETALPTWQITIGEGQKDDFELRVEIPYVNPGDEQDYETDSRTIWIYRGTDSGLVYRDYFDWDENGQITGVNEDAVWSRAGDVYYPEMPGGTLQVAFCSWNGEAGEWEYQELDQSVLFFSGEGIGWAAREENHTYLELYADTLAKGSFSYTTGGETYELDVEFRYPFVGFYRDAEHTQLMTDTFYYDPNGNIYIYAPAENPGLGDHEEIRLQNVTFDGHDIPYNPVEGTDGLYILACSELDGEGELYVDFMCSDIDAEEEVCNWSDSRRIYCQKMGLVFTWPYLDENGTWYVAEESIWRSDIHMERVGHCFIALGIRNADGNVNMLQMEKEDSALSFQPVGDIQDGYEIAPWFASETDKTTCFVQFGALMEGEYLIQYGEESLKIYIELPKAGFYSTDQRSSETYLRDYEYVFDKDHTGFYLICDMDQDESDRFTDIKWNVSGEHVDDISAYVNVSRIDSADESQFIWKIEPAETDHETFGLEAELSFGGWIIESGYISIEYVKDIASCTVEISPKVVGSYNGQPQYPDSIVVKDGNKILLRHQDYEIADIQNNIGAGKVFITIVGKGYYNGVNTDGYFIIKEKNISELTVSGAGEQTYTGRAIEPQMTLKNGELVLEKDVDYTISYSNNVNPGTATATIVGKGNYTGNRKVTFTIKDAVMVGWKYIGGKWYYYNSQGIKQTGWVKVGGKWYYMNSSGIMQTGWIRVGNAWYYMNSSGAMVTGWLKLGNTWYYMNSSGAMVTGWLKLGNTWYYFKSSGAMATGWLKIGSTWYYMKSSGAMVTGWLKLGNTWYYFKSNGAMVNSNTIINGRMNRFNASGAWLGTM